MNIIIYVCEFCCKCMFVEFSFVVMIFYKCSYYSEMDDIIRNAKDALSKCQKRYKFVPNNNYNTQLAIIFEKYRKQLGWYTELYKIKRTELFEWYPPYAKLDLESKTVAKFSKLTDLFEKKDNNYTIEKNTQIYKGTKYFYTPQQEKEVTKNIEFVYFGDKYIAYRYANRYYGGIQVYNVVDDIAVFNVTNDRNIRYIISKLKKHDASAICVTDVFGNDITYGKVVDIMHMKYGVDIDKCEQLDMIATHDRYDLVWLRFPSNEYEYRDNNEYHGWYFGAGYIDRICTTAIKKIIGVRHVT